MSAWRALFVPFDEASPAQLFFSQSWWPRLSLALLVGAGLALTGEMLQLVLRNPFASDTTLGVASGASLALMLVTLYFPSLLVFGQAWFAILGAAIVLLCVFSLGRKHALNPMVVLLAGMTLNLLMGGISILFLMLNHETLSGLLVWGSGSLVQQGWSGVNVVFWELCAVVVLLLVVHRPLRLLALDDATLKGLGFAVGVIRLYVLTIAVFLAGSLVSQVGVISFVGLIAPHSMRLLGMDRFLKRWPFSMLFGGLLLATADLTVQRITDFTGLFIPTGAITAMIGVPFFLWLLLRLKSSSLSLDSFVVNQGVSISDSSGRFYGLIIFSLLSVVFVLYFGRDIESSRWQFHWHGIWWQWGWPRTLMAACGGVLLAWAGTLLQRMTGNPMASPEFLGISSASAIALLLAVFILDSPTYVALLGFGILGAIFAFMLIIYLGKRTQFSVEVVLLTGVALGILYEAIRSLLLAEGDPRGQQMTAWLAGSTYYATAQISLFLLLMVVLFLPIVLSFSRALDVMSLGTNTAQALGFPIKKLRLTLLVIIAVLCVLATLVLGPLSFIGLIAPHLARLMGFYRAHSQLLAAALVGAVSMVWADWLGRQVIFPYEIPAGIIASVLGGGYFIWCLARDRHTNNIGLGA